MLKRLKYRYLEDAFHCTFATSVLLITHYIKNPNWFTTSYYTIDPWIYWGSGNNLPLSYQADFSQTYYLERYTITFQQIIAQFLFGPYWSQLLLVGFSIFVISFLGLQILRLHGQEKIALPIFLVFFLNFKVLGMLAMSYNQSTSLILYFSGVYALMKYLKTFDSKYICIFGFLMGLLANAYLPHFIVGYVMATFVLIQFTNLKTTLFLITRSFPYFIFAQFIIQTLHYIVARDYQIVFLKHLRFGISNIASRNPWGGEGFTWFWSKGIFSPQSFFWSSLIFMTVLLTVYTYISKTQNLWAIYSTATGTLIGLSFFSFGHSNIIGYSWMACVLYFTMFPVLIWIFQSKSRILNITLAGTVIAIHFFFSKDYSGIVSRLVSAKTFRPMVIIVLVLFLLLLAFFSNNILIKSIPVSAYILILVMQSAYFISSEGGMEREFNAKRIYERLDSERHGLEKLRSSEARRVWITPLESIPLQSSMLYLYSLVSSDPTKENCSQVNWMKSSKSLLVITDSSYYKTNLAEKNFLKPCGLNLDDWGTTTFDNINFSYLRIN